MRTKIEIAVAALLIIAGLQIGHNQRNIGYYDARIQECMKPTNSDNIRNTNIIKHPDGFAMERECMAIARKVWEKNRVWFWNANESFDENWYHELWHY